MKKIKSINIKNSNHAIVKLMAKEFLEERLGVHATVENIRRFSAHIVIFEKEIKNRKLNKNKFLAF